MVGLSNLTVPFFCLFLSLLSHELSHCHLEEARDGFSLAYPTRQHHHPRVSGPLLSEAGVTGAQALWLETAHLSTASYTAATWRESAAGRCWVRPREAARDSITLLRRAPGLTPSDCLALEFSISGILRLIFGTGVDWLQVTDCFLDHCTQVSH